MDAEKLQSIILGIFPIKLAGVNYFVAKPSSMWRLESARIEYNFLAQFLDGGLLCEQDYQYFLYSNNIWSDAEESRLKSLYKDIEELKVRLFQLNFNEKELAKARNVLAMATADVDKLNSKKHSYTFLSAASNAKLQRMKFLFAGAIQSSSGEPLFKTFKSYSVFPCPILDAAIAQYRDLQADEAEIRLFARTEPWRSYWAARKATGKVFECASIDLTEQQRALIAWSVTYDAIAEHPKCPSDDIIGDDVRLDGWLILQKRERDKQLGNNDLDNIVKNENIRKSAEVFIPASSKADIEKIDSLNSDEAARRKNQRLSLVFKKGKVQEAEMPDSQIEINRLAHEKFKGK